MTATKNVIPLEHTDVIIGKTHAPDECKGERKNMEVGYTK